MINKKEFQIALNSIVQNLKKIEQISNKTLYEELERTGYFPEILGFNLRNIISQIKEHLPDADIHYQKFYRYIHRKGVRLKKVKKQNCSNYNKYYDMFTQGYSIEEIAKIFNKEKKYVSEMIKKEININKKKEINIVVEKKEELKKFIVKKFRENGYCEPVKEIEENYIKLHNKNQKKHSKNLTIEEWGELFFKAKKNMSNSNKFLYKKNISQFLLYLKIHYPEIKVEKMLDMQEEILNRYKLHLKNKEPEETIKKRLIPPVKKFINYIAENIE